MSERTIHRRPDRRKTIGGTIDVHGLSMLAGFRLYKKPSAVWRNWSWKPPQGKRGRP